MHLSGNQEVRERVVGHVEKTRELIIHVAKRKEIATQHEPSRYRESGCEENTMRLWWMNKQRVE